jgi:hypothetical protein
MRYDMDEQNSKLAAPYLPYSTFETGLNHLHNLGGVPPNIDRTIFPNMDGTAKGQIISAFRFLGLIDEKGAPQDSLKELALNKETRKQVLRRIIKERYPNIVEAELGAMSIGQLDAKLGDKAYNVSGGTKQKARSFLLKAAETAGIPLSRLLTAKGSRGPRKKKTRLTGEITLLSKLSKDDKGKNSNDRVLDPTNVRMPIALSPDRVIYIEMPKDLDPKDAKKLLALLGLSLDVPVQFPEGM